MKFILDNNLPPKLADALNCLCSNNEMEEVVVHLRRKFPANTKDEVWITALSKERGWAIISHDRFNKNFHEKEALRKSGLVVFILKDAWQKVNFWEQSYNLVRWWPRIMEQADGIKGGAVFEVPFKFSGKGKFEQVRF